jgi:hypothetical protein
MCVVVQVEEEVIDGSVANASALPTGETKTLARGGERLSLTVRRVLRVRSILMPQK